MEMENNNYKSRIAILMMVVFLGYCVIIARALFLQGFQNTFFENLAQGQYQVAITITPSRGLISDRNGDLIALNKEVPSVFILPNKLKAKDRVSLFLKKHYPEVFERFRKNSSKKFLWVDRNIESAQLKFLEEGLGEDFCLIYEPKRYYPFLAMANVIGFTDIDNNGLSGIELHHEKSLRGITQTLLLERDARSRNFYFDKLQESEGAMGQPIGLTLDKTLQTLAFEELKETIHSLEAKMGSILIMNPDTGEILAMVNYPSFDSNEKVTPDLMPLTKNMVITECYELGSVMKMFTALAALQEKVVQYDEIIDCEGRFAYIDGFKVENPTISLLNRLKEMNNKLPFYEVVRYSSNVGIAKVAKKLGPKLYDYLRGCSFGKKTGVSFPGERSGFINHPKKWSRSSVLVLSFGYEIMATVLQLGIATSIVANGGYLVNPILTMGELNLKKMHEKMYDREAIAQMQTIMESIGEKFPVLGYTVRGKTGTARCLENGAYVQNKNIFTFAGMIEKGSYRRVVITFISEVKKKGVWASQTAAPLFQRVAQKMASYEEMKELANKLE